MCIEGMSIQKPYNGNFFFQIIKLYFQFIRFDTIEIYIHKYMLYLLFLISVPVISDKLGKPIVTFHLADDDRRFHCCCCRRDHNRMMMTFSRNRVRTER